MPDLATIPCLNDNYAYLLHDPATGHTTLIDAPQAAPILSALDELGWALSQILLTHHHADHIQAVPDLVAATNATVLGAAADAHRLPPLTRRLREGDTVAIGSETAHVLDVSGHTLGHLAFVLPGLAFTADSLMAAGCGRLFEGTPALMWQSLGKLAALPPETMICSGHEYTTANLRFALTIEPDSPALLARIAAVAAARAADHPTVPSRLSDELATNPFLRAHLPQIKAQIGLPHASDVETFTEIRARKDRF
ncbi:MAG: hydroxyacylglutathione hydrolase [Alphaproteobacteria bacterium]